MVLGAGQGRLMGLRIIAEGIESAATVDLLRRMGCEEGQGYYFGKPMAVAEFEHLFFEQSAAHFASSSGAEPPAAAA